MFDDSISFFPKYSFFPLHCVKLTHQLSFKNLTLNVDHHTGDKWFTHGPKHCKENQLLTLKHSWVYYVNQI